MPAVCPDCAAALPPCRSLPPFVGAGPGASGHGGVLFERARLAMLDPQGEYDQLAPWPPRFDWEANDWQPERVGRQAGAVVPLDAVKARQTLLHLAEPEPFTVYVTSSSINERDLLDRLGVPSDRDHGMIRCPAHEDRNASLSWRYSDGRALLHCHAGCTFDEIRAAL